MFPTQENVIVDIKEFQKKNKPVGRKSRLEPFRAGILELKNHGYANFQIAEWLALNGINVSQQTVRQFIKTNKESSKPENKNNIVEQKIIDKSYDPREIDKIFSNKPDLNALEKFARENKL